MAPRRLYAELEGRYGRETECEVSCYSMWGGKMYLMFYYDIYKDVRLVGTPPASIGAFGGDYDNWGWPQHKGDFALYRVYADREGRPAAYSADNVPLKPRRVLQVATGGVHDGDFAMVIGFPGRTNRYASSFAVAEKQCVRNPIVVANRHDRMDILKRHMERDPRVRMEYSDAYFGLSNYADYAKWENKCLRRFDVVAIREAEEEHLQRWIEADSARKAEDGTLLEELARGYEARQGAERNLNYFREAWLGPSEALLVANRVSSYLGKLERLKQDSLIVDSKDARSVVAGSGRLSRNYDAATDRDLLARMVVNFTANVPREMWGAQLQAMYDKAGGNADRMARAAFDASFCSDPARYDAYFSKNRSVAEIRRDPMVALTESVTVQRFTGGVDKAEKRGRARVGRSESRYADVLYDFRASEGLAQYPNANSTMRLTYGSVQPLNPSDGVHYDSRSTIAGYGEVQPRRIRIPRRRPYAAADRQTGLGTLGRERYALCQFPDRQRHYGRQFGQPRARRQGASYRACVRRQPRVDGRRRVVPSRTGAHGVRGYPLCDVGDRQVCRCRVVARRNEVRKIIRCAGGNRGIPTCQADLPYGRSACLRRVESVCPATRI